MFHGFDYPERISAAPDAQDSFTNGAYIAWYVAQELPKCIAWHYQQLNAKERTNKSALTNAYQKAIDDMETLLKYNFAKSGLFSKLENMFAKKSGITACVFVGQSNGLFSIINIGDGGCLYIEKSKEAKLLTTTIVDVNGKIKQHCRKNPASTSQEASEIINFGLKSTQCFGLFDEKGTHRIEAEINHYDPLKMEDKVVLATQLLFTPQFKYADTMAENYGKDAVGRLLWVKTQNTNIDYNTYHPSSDLAKAAESTAQTTPANNVNINLFDNLGVYSIIFSVENPGAYTETIPSSSQVNPILAPTMIRSNDTPPSTDESSATASASQEQLDEVAHITQENATQSSTPATVPSTPAELSTAQKIMQFISDHKIALGMTAAALGGVFAYQKGLTPAQKQKIKEWIREQSQQGLQQARQGVQQLTENGAAFIRQHVTMPPFISKL